MSRVRYGAIAKYVTATLNELRQSTCRLGAGVYEYWGRCRNLYRQACDALSDLMAHGDRVTAGFLDLERLYYAEGGFLITMPKVAVGSITECTSITTGRIWPRDLR